MARKPKPTKLKIIAGNPGKRPLPDAEPEFSGVPDCPAWLNEEARAIWGQVVPELAAKGILGRIDQACIAAYCQAYARWKQAEAEIEANGITFIQRFPNKEGDLVIGDMKKNPAVTVSNEAQKLLRSFAAEYGLTAASRSKVRGTKGNEPKDEAQKYFG